MANREAHKNAPTSQLKALEGSGYCSTTVNRLQRISALAEVGTPTDTEQLKSRIIGYFNICEETDSRPGIEGLCLCLGISRQTLWNWCNGEGGHSEEFTKVCQQAKQLIAAFLEDSTQNGRINPISFVFLAKNWLGYQNEIAIQAKPIEEKSVISVADLPKLPNATSDTDEFQTLAEELPILDNFD